MQCWAGYPTLLLHGMLGLGSLMYRGRVVLNISTLSQTTSLSLRDTVVCDKLWKELERVLWPFAVNEIVRVHNALSSSSESAKNHRMTVYNVNI